LALINGIAKLILDNTNPNENVYFSTANNAVFINAGYGEKKCRIFSIEYKKRDKEFRINYNEPDYRIGKNYYIGKPSWISILELSYTELKEILLYLTTHSSKIGKYAQSMTNDALKKINQ